MGDDPDKCHGMVLDTFRDREYIEFSRCVVRHGADQTEDQVVLCDVRVRYSPHGILGDLILAVILGMRFRRSVDELKEVEFFPKASSFTKEKVDFQ